MGGGASKGIPFQSQHLNLSPGTKTISGCIVYFWMHLDVCVFMGAHTIPSISPQSLSQLLPPTSPLYPRPTRIPNPSLLAERPLTTASTSTAALIFLTLWSLDWRLQRHPQADPRGLFWGTIGEQDRKDFPTTSHYRVGKVYHKSCLDWCRLLHYFFKYFFQGATFCYFFCGGGDEKEEGS